MALSGVFFAQQLHITLSLGPSAAHVQSEKLQTCLGLPEKAYNKTIERDVNPKPSWIRTTLVSK